MSFWFSKSPLIVWVNETATAAKETLLVTWPNAWHTATGINSLRSFESIGYTENQPVAWYDKYVLQETFTTK